MSNDDMRLLKEELHGALIANGRTPSEADDIVVVAAQAAREAMQRLIEVIGTAPGKDRDAAIILALSIMERLALAGYKVDKVGKNEPDQG